MILLAAAPAFAEGAVAFGTTGDVAQDGYSIGFSYDYATEEQARQNALDWCRNHGGERRTEDKCEIVAVFHLLCGAEAQDPKPGTPGAGWALGPDVETAKKIALANCRMSAGRNRMDYCKVTSSGCDTKKK
jgi:hypothetical protein